MQWLNYHHLFYFWTIAKEDGITKACKVLRLSQPTLSAQLKQFEDSVGKPLFERKSRKLILTETGKTVFDYADSIFKTGRELLDALQNQGAKGRVDFRIGVLSSLPKKNVYDFLQPLLRQSHIHLTVVMSPLESLLQRLMSNDLDAILSNRRVDPDFSGVRHHHLERVPIVFAASKDFRGLKKRFPQSLEGKPLFIPIHQTYLRPQIDEFLRQHEVSPLIRGEIQDSELLRVIAVSGDGVVTIEQTAISDLIKSKELIVLGESAGLSEDIFLIVADRKNISPTVTEILKKYPAS